LAQSLNVHPNNLSQVINTFEGKTFFDYVNQKRIEEFKRIVSLPENQKFTLLALAHDCGFNSKTSFNRNFKNCTGLSPSEYLREAKIELVA
jgi:AraC-like DNA-binding protein